ncbi:biogenesis of lysosome-related organelles complex-1 subunit 1 [Conidiobolus coronatus NRRL 28638]|uniref:Biogenesis of lysosome-related organelles complex 1 subunit 1 n=1 Tax=Conidiobolus coronatus (strain ATCC 28846 / CBS 209.66 / NRRL 28638) TaxID=796925 RepID=A0A137PHU1_CONC2|nr:biogenesis of lysosome-related organelles complex-1 subunit 1 [Conidiobolus coronatus NRRL 28638]|eukprot:KXN74574.1 biogenesis of lysosome-related organelles complex-1 subunit 1 [Conidiobolus coronatus NRRL 28638]
MLSQLLKDHQNSQLEQKNKITQLRREAVQSIRETTDIVTDSLNAQVSECIQTQKQLENHTKLLTQQLSKFQKQTQLWSNMVQGLNDSLKELGDVQNYVNIMERNMEIVQTTLTNVVKEREKYDF